MGYHRSSDIFPVRGRETADLRLQLYVLTDYKNIYTFLEDMISLQADRMIKTIYNECR